MLLVEFTNFGRGDKSAHHLAAMERVASRLKAHDGPAVHAMCEITEGDVGYDERAMMQKLWPEPDWHYVGGRHTMIPQASKKLEVLEHHFKIITTGIKHVSPARPVMDVLYKMPNGAKFFVISWHPIQGAFTDPNQVDEKQRTQGFWDCWDYAQTRAQYYGRKQIPGFAGGDLNAPSLPEAFVPNQNVLVHRSLDYAIWCPARNGAQFHVKHTGAVNTGIDPHDSIWVAGELTNR